MFTLIQTSEDLRLLNEELLECHYVALDTEFRRTSKENIKLALLQVNDAKEVYLIDCLENNSGSIYISESLFRSESLPLTNKFC